MKADFPALWANSPGTLRREPTNTEMAGGFPCGDLDIKLFNELTYRLAQVYREAITAIVESGQTPNANNTGQLWAAIQRAVLAGAQWHYGIDTSSNPAIIVANVAPDIAGYVAGTIHGIIAANDAQSGGTTANLDTRGSRPVRRLDASHIQAGDWKSGDLVLFVDDGTVLRLVNRVVSVPSIGQSHYGLAGGSATAITVPTLTPPLTLPYERGTLALIEMPTGFGFGAGATIRLATGAIVDLLRNDGSPVADGDGPPGSLTLIAYDGSDWRLAGFGRAEVQRVAVNPTLYVSPSGSDTTGDGSPGAPFREIAKALAVGTSAYNFATSTLSIMVANGTYAPIGAAPRGSGQIRIVGNTSTPSAVVIAGSSVGGFDALTLVRGDYTISGVTFRNTGTSANTFATLTGASAIFLDCLFQITASGHTGAHLFVSGTTTIAEGCSFEGDSGSLIVIAGGAARCAINSSTTATLLGTPDFPSGTIVARDGGQFAIPAGSGFSGGATGIRAVIREGIVNVHGAGVNAIPGDQPYTILAGGFGAYRP